MLPSVSCMAKASTAVITAEVATMLVRSTPAPRSCDEAVDHVDGDDGQVLDDARRGAAEQRQQQAEGGEADRRISAIADDEAEHHVDGAAAPGKSERLDQPQPPPGRRCRTGTATACSGTGLRSCGARCSSTTATPNATSASQGAAELRSERARGAVQNRILPVSMSFHITQSPMKL